MINIGFVKVESIIVYGATKCKIRQCGNICRI